MYEKQKKKQSLKSLDFDKSGVNLTYRQIWQPYAPRWRISGDNVVGMSPAFGWHNQIIDTLTGAVTHWLTLIYAHWHSLTLIDAIVDT